MYLGGMILSSIDAAYAYEEALASFIQRRNKMFEGDTFWGRNKDDLLDLVDVMEFPADAFYYVPEDPLISIPDHDRIVLLKRQYLNRLRQRFMKLQRQNKPIADYVSEQLDSDGKQAVLRHINIHRQQHGLEPIKEVWW